MKRLQRAGARKEAGDTVSVVWGAWKGKRRRRHLHNTCFRRRNLENIHFLQYFSNKHFFERINGGDLVKTLVT